MLEDIDQYGLMRYMDTIPMEMQRCNKSLELTQNQRSARGGKMWRAIIILPSESVSGSSSSLTR